MKTFYTVVIALLTLLAVSMSAMAQGIRKPSGSSTDPNFSLGAGLIFGGMHSEVMSGAYLDAAIGKSRIDLNFEEEITSNPSTNYVNSLPDPVPIFKRISLEYGREIVHGLASVRLAAGPEYTWGTADGKYLYSDKTSAIAGLSTDYYESNPFSRMGVSLDANVNVPISRHCAFGLRSSLTIDGVETYGLLGMTFGYVFD